MPKISNYGSASFALKVAVRFYAFTLKIRYGGELHMIVVMRYW